MEKRKLVLTIIGVVILAMVIMVYIYFSKPGRDEKKNQQTINQVQTVQQKIDEKKENTEKNTSGDELENVTPGSEEYRGFLLDNVLHSPNEGDIRNIREKIEDNPSKPVYIQTVWGAGYRFNKNLSSGL